MSTSLGMGMGRDKEEIMTMPAPTTTRKDRKRSMKNPAGNTMEPILGENVHSTGRATITKVTAGEITTTTEGAIRETQTQTQAIGPLGREPTPSVLMKAAS